MNAGTATRQRQAQAMQATAIGAKLARHARAWTVVVPVCITGPCWADVGLRPVAAAPVQRELLGVAAC